MSAESLSRPVAKLYEEDFIAWAYETARLPREGRLDQLDIEHVAEEIEGMANRDRRELLSRLTVLIHHLLKWGWQPKKRSGCRKLTITSQRIEIDRQLEESPSLRRILAPSIPRVYRDAVKAAASETGRAKDAFPRYCPFSLAEILDEDFLHEI